MSTPEDLLDKFNIYSFLFRIIQDKLVMCITLQQETVLHYSLHYSLSLGKSPHTHPGELIAEIRLTRKHVSLHAAFSAGRVENPAKSSNL